MNSPLRLLGLVAVPFLLASCEVGPDYVAPSAPVPSHYKDKGNWKPANPQDAVVRGKWWEIYHDPELNALEDKVNIDNQNVLQAEANFREAAAAVKVSRAEFFPTVTTNPAITFSQTQPLGKNTGSGSSGVATNSGGAGGTSVVGGGGGRDISPEGVYNLPLQVTYLVSRTAPRRRRRVSPSSKTRGFPTKAPSPRTTSPSAASTLRLSCSATRSRPTRLS